MVLRMHCPRQLPWYLEPGFHNLVLHRKLFQDQTSILGLVCRRSRALASLHEGRKVLFCGMCYSITVYRLALASVCPSRGSARFQISVGTKCDQGIFGICFVIAHFNACTSARQRFVLCHFLRVLVHDRQPWRGRWESISCRGREDGCYITQ